MNRVRAGVEALGDLFEVGPVHIGQEAHVEIVSREGAERGGGHGRPQIRPADADVHHRLPPPAAGFGGEGGHTVELFSDLGRRVGPAQCGVPSGAVLGGVHRIANQHGLDPVAESGPVGQGSQQHHRLIGEAVLGVVQHQPVGLGSEPIPPTRIAIEQVPQMHVIQCLPVGAQRLPLTGFLHHRSVTVANCGRAAYCRWPATRRRWLPGC